MIHSLQKIKKLVGNTPVHQLNFDKCRLYAKLEFANYSGSIKARPAISIIEEFLKNNKLTPQSTIIESTSGNFGIALALISRYIGVKFIAVYDANISKEKEKQLRLFSYDTVKIDVRDPSGSYLGNRIKYVKEYLKNHPSAITPNQYENEQNFLSYYNGMGVEIAGQFDRLDYIFIAVSTGGTIVGLSNRLKKSFPGIKIIAVDVQGSLIFQNQPKKRFIAGMGSSCRSEMMNKALNDEVIILEETEIVKGCHALLNEQSVFAGGSSGAVYRAATEYLSNNQVDLEAKALIICPDGGEGYLDNVYNPHWVAQNINQEIQTIQMTEDLS